MSYLVSYTSEQGVTIGATSDSLVGALALMADEFGEDMVHLFAHAKQELQALVKEQSGRAEEAVTSELYGRLRVDRVDAGPAVDGAGAPPGDDPAPGGADRDAPATDQRGEGGETGVDGTTVTGGTVDPALADTSEPPPADDPRCLVCGETLTDEMVKASTLMFGEQRCRDCFAF